MGRNYYVRKKLDVAEDNSYCVIASLAIWVFSFIYFIDFGYFIIFYGEEQIYLFIFAFITDDSVLLKLLCS